VKTPRMKTWLFRMDSLQYESTQYACKHHTTIKHRHACEHVGLASTQSALQAHLTPIAVPLPEISPLYASQAVHAEGAVVTAAGALVCAYRHLHQLTHLPEQTMACSGSGSVGVATQMHMAPQTHVKCDQGE